MKILIISTFFPPLNSIASQRPYSWAKYWSSENHEVTVLTTAKEENFTEPASFNVVSIDYIPWIQKWRPTYQAQTRGPSKRSFWDYLHRLRTKTGILNACRMPDLTHAWVRPAFRAIKSEAPWDLIVSSSGPYPVHILAAKLKKRGLAKKWIADYRDPWSDHFAYPGLFPFNAIEKWLERRIMKLADFITTVSDPLRDRLATHHGHKVFTIENGFDSEEIDSLQKTRILPENGKLHIVHTGSLFEGKRDPSPLFKAIRVLQEDPSTRNLLDHLSVHFFGPAQANLEILIQLYQVEPWVKQGGTVCRSDALRYQRDADYLLFLPWNDPQVDGVLSGKIFEYLASTTPILAVGADQWEVSQKLIVEAKAGEVFLKPQGIEPIASFLLNALKNRSVSKNNIDQQFLNRYHRKTQAYKMLRLT